MMAKSVGFFQMASDMGALLLRWEHRDDRSTETIGAQCRWEHGLDGCTVMAGRPPALSILLRLDHSGVKNRDIGIQISDLKSPR